MPRRGLPGYMPTPMTPTKALVLLGALALVSGCNKEKVPATSAGSAASAGQCDDPIATNEVLAKLGDEKISPRARSTRRSPAAREREPRGPGQSTTPAPTSARQADGEGAQGRAGLQRGVPVEELVKTEVEKAVPKPPDDQMKQVFDQAQAAGKLPPNVTFEQVKPQIAQFLTQAPREKAIEVFFKKLLKEQNGALLPLRAARAGRGAGPSKGPRAPR